MSAARVSRDDLIAAAIFAVLALAPALAHAMGAGYWVSLLTRIVIFALAALALDLALGLGGLVSLGHAAFVGIGAYAAAILAQEGYGDLLIALPVALAASGLYAAIMGVVSLRTRGVAFIMITLAFGQVAYFLAQSLYAYGGDDGMSLPARATLAGWRLFETRLGLHYLALAALALAYVFARRLALSRFGRALVGARENEARMASLGYDVTAIRLRAFIASGMMAGAAGVLLVNQSEFVSPAYLSWQRSGELLFMTIMGGMGTLWGAMLGAAGYLLAEDALSHLGEHWKAAFGALIVVFALVQRGGLSALLDRALGPRAIGDGR